MHETLLDDIKFNLDRLEYQQDTYLIVGWVLSQNKTIDRIRLDASDAYHCELSQFHPRNDVNQYYHLSDNALTGFKLIIHLDQPIDDFVFSIKYKDDLHFQTFAIVENPHHTKTPKNKLPNIEINNTFPALVVVDNFYNDPDAVRDYALKQAYQDNLNDHKGSRSIEKTIFSGTKEAFEFILNKRVTNWETHIYNGVFQYCIAEDSLVYHTDNQTYAAMIFLTPDAPVETGTSFYRSKFNKLMREPTAEDCERLNSSAEELVENMFAHNYYDKTRWELLDTVGNVYNRLVIFDAKRVHSASEYFGDCKENGRLFHIFFFDTE